MEDIKNWLENTIKMMVDSPDEVQVDSKTDEMGVLLTVKVGSSQGRSEAGKIIGREAKTINSLRDIVHALGTKRSAKVSIKLDAPPREKYPPRDSLAI